MGEGGWGRIFEVKALWAEEVFGAKGLWTEGEWEREFLGKTKRGAFDWKQYGGSEGL